MWRLGLIYTTGRRGHHGKSIARSKEKENSTALFRGRSLILIGSLPLFQPVLEFVSLVGDYGESETGIIPRNKANNYPCRDFDRIFRQKLRRIVKFIFKNKPSNYISVAILIADSKINHWWKWTKILRCFFSIFFFFFPRTLQYPMKIYI